MKTKLTLRMDERLIEAAKAEAATRGVSLSRMVESFFAGMLRKPGKASKLGPITSKLYGRLAGAKIDEEDYLRYIEDKYR